MGKDVAAHRPRANAVLKRPAAAAAASAARGAAAGAKQRAKAKGRAAPAQVEAQAEVEAEAESAPVLASRWHLAVWQKALEVPAGQVTSYGDIAKALGCPAHSRHVGKALHFLPPTFKGKEVPWWRIVASSGALRTGGNRQRVLLEEEGVPVKIGVPCRVDKFDQWRCDLKLEEQDEDLVD